MFNMLKQKMDEQAYNHNSTMDLTVYPFLTEMGGSVAVPPSADTALFDFNPVASDLESFALMNMYHHDQTDTHITGAHMLTDRSQENPLYPS